MYALTDHQQTGTHGFVLLEPIVEVEPSGIGERGGKLNILFAIIGGAVGEQCLGDFQSVVTLRLDKSGSIALRGYEFQGLVLG